MLSLRQSLYFAQMATSFFRASSAAFSRLPVLDQAWAAMSGST
jgi:hypothetical protein